MHPTVTNNIHHFNEEDIYLFHTSVCLLTSAIFPNPDLLAIPVIIYQFIVPFRHRLPGAMAPLSCTKRSRAFCMCQIVRHQFIREEFPSLWECCRSRNESELTLLVSQQLNHTVLASASSCSLTRNRNRNSPPPHSPKILHSHVSCSFCHHSQKCVCVCVSL